MTDWRGLCEELLEAMASTGEAASGSFADLLDRARAALAAEADGPAVPESREPASVVGEPSDVGLLELMPQQFRDDLATVSRMAAHGAGTGVTPGLFRVSLNTGALDYARAVLARYGHQPAPPAEGEQRHPTPVPVAERLPGPEDCDAEGRCWWFCFECPGEYSYWILAKEVYCEPTYWLPATALPLPSGEVQP